MSMYWIYDFPNWQLGVATVLLFASLSVLGLWASQPVVRRLLKGSSEHNDVVSYIFAGIGVFYGLALGLIAVATWEDFNEVDGLVNREAAALAGLYRDLDGYQPEMRAAFEAMLRDYTRHVIEQDWPLHRQGQISEKGSQMLDALENRILAFEPSTEREKIVHADVLGSLDNVVEQHRLRLQSVGTGLPASLWSVVLVGALLNITLTYLFWVENRLLHVLLVAIFATFIGLLIFLTAAMDCPFRGEFSVSPEAFQLVLDNVMSPKHLSGSHSEMIRVPL